MPINTDRFSRTVPPRTSNTSQRATSTHSDNMVSPSRTSSAAKTASGLHLDLKRPPGSKFLIERRGSWMDKKKKNGKGATRRAMARLAESPRSGVLGWIPTRGLCVRLCVFSVAWVLSRYLGDVRSHQANWPLCMVLQVAQSSTGALVVRPDWLVKAGMGSKLPTPPPPPAPALLKG